MNKKILSIVAIIALVAVLAVCLVACNSETYEKKLDKAGYSVAVSEDGSIAVKSVEAVMALDGTYKGGVDWIVAGVSSSDTVKVMKFEKMSDAKKYVEEVCGGKSDTATYIGSYVITGTAQGVKDAK